MPVRDKKKKKTKGSRDVRSVTCCIFSHNRFASILAIIPAGCVLYNKCGQLSRQQLVLIYVIKQSDPPPRGSCKLQDPPLAQGSKPHNPPPLCSGPTAPPPPPILFDQSLISCKLNMNTILNNSLADTVLSMQSDHDRVKLCACKHM